jgi:hypothetical protein
VRPEGVEDQRPGCQAKLPRTPFDVHFALQFKQNHVIDMYASQKQELSSTLFAGTMAQ